MKHTTINGILIGAICLLLPFGAGTQVNPGDADNNGVVDNHDILYVGYAFGATGPRRIGSDVQSDSMPVTLYWTEHFPTGQNYIFADADGNGLVDWQDFIAVYDRYGAFYHDLRASAYPAGEPATNPSLAFRRPADPGPYTEGSLIELPLFLGSADRPVNEFQGLAFTVRFDSSLVREIRLSVDSASWLTAGQGAFPFQLIPPGREGALDVAVTRLGQDPVSGFGYVGTLSIIIEDDLIDFRPVERDSIHTYIHLDLIEMRDVDFNPILVASRPLQLTLVNPRLVSAVDIVPESGLSVYPNPVTDWLRLDAEAPIRSIEIWDLQGRLLYRRAGDRARSIHCPLPKLPPGPLILKVQTEKGLSVQKILCATGRWE